VKQYRIICLGNFAEYYSYFLMNVQQGAFLNGHLCRPVPLFGQGLNQIKEQISWFKPHLVLAHMIFNQAPHHRPDVLEMLRKIRSKGALVGYHAGDARDVPRYPQSIKDYVDFALVNHWPLLPSYKVWNVPCYHWPYAALNQKSIGDRIPEFFCELAFTGALGDNEHHAPRTKFINSIKNNIKLKVFPTETSGNTRFQTSELAASADAVLGFQMGLNMPGYLDVRPFQYIGAGALYFHDKCQAMDQFFVPYDHYIPFERDNVKDFLEKYNLWAKNPSRYLAIKEKGFNYCQQHHSSQSRMKSIINAVLNGMEYHIEYWK
jgi:hypothetical protein